MLNVSNAFSQKNIHVFLTAVKTQQGAERQDNDTYV